MATEPVNTSNSYSASDAYTPPVGRLPVLGKARVQIDQIRASIAATLNEMKNRDSLQADAHLRALAEVALLDQKTATELANTSNVIPTTVGIDSTGSTRTTYLSTNEDTVAPVGVIGAQQALYDAQKKGFARDAEQKLTKIMADTWSIQKSMADNMNPDEAGIAEFQMLEVVNKARAGIGLDPAVPIP